MKLTMLGTGNALATECYNTCFILDNNGQLLMVDGGGGNTILHQVKHAGYNWMNIHHIFVTHKHVDHLMGIIWMMRVICQSMNQGKYQEEAYIYSHREVLDIISSIAGKLLSPKETQFIGDQLHLVEVTDGDRLNIISHDITFFDIHSTKAKQYGFCMEIEEGKKLTCCGDEPCSAYVEKYALNSEWLLHEAFCLFSERELFNPYEKHHSTVKDACKLAEKLNIKNLLLYHTEDKNLAIRNKLYIDEGSAYYHGNLYIPNDLDSLEL